MALQGWIEFAGLGADTGYWRLGWFSIDGLRRIVTIRFDGYASQIAFESGHPAIASVQKEVSMEEIQAHFPTEYAATDQNLYPLIYKIVKTWDEFTDYVDA